MIFSGRAKRETAKGEAGPGTHIFPDFCRFSLILGSLCKSRDLGVADSRRKPQDFRRKPQETADFCRNRFLPLAASFLARSYVISFFLFVVFPGLRGFLFSTTGPRNHNAKWTMTENQSPRHPVMIVKHSFLQEEARQQQCSMHALFLLVFAPYAWEATDLGNAGSSSGSSRGSGRGSGRQ